MTKACAIALAGNPNAGKTTVFNALTGARQHVGNYPGITVERKVGTAKAGDTELRITDLPGTYSLTAYSQEELVARRVLIEEKPDAVINVVNAGVLERNLYLTVQLLEIGVPLVVSLNMMDEAKRQGLTINVKRLSELLGAPVIETVARTGRGVEETALAAARLADKRKGEKLPLVISYGPDLDPVIAEMAEMLGQAGFSDADYAPRWLAIKYLEGDAEVMDMIRGRDQGLAERLGQMAERVADHCQKTLGTYPEALIADYRYGFISSILKQDVVQLNRIDRVALSDRIDTVLTHKLLGPAAMLGILYAIYQFTFVVGDIPMGWMADFFSWLGDVAGAALPEGHLRSLVVSGVIDGVGGVLSFVPLIAIIFLIISFLEDSGYMARIAYMLDRLFRMFGLHGCSVMPFIVSGGIAGGCAVPGVMAARTLRSRREKLATVLTAPFMTCGAKLPVFLMLVAIFFPDNQAQAMFLVTLAAWLIALLVAKLLRSTVISGPSTPFVMELPPYRLPTLRGMCIHTWERTWHFIKRATTVVLPISILLWAAMTYPGLPESDVEQFETARTQIEAQVAEAETLGDEDLVAGFEDALAEVEAEEAMAALKNSLAGRFGVALEGVTKWAGYEWRTNIALAAGFAAKEVIVSTLGTAYSLGETDPEEAEPLMERLKNEPGWTMAKGVSLILFTMLYAPCFMTVFTIRQESGSWGWAVFSMVFNTALAFAAAVTAYQILS
ncbi:ferrous iron transport protein B [Alkalidesulfovibrio alkalitolerans DSM 16529]|uniref:Ferrous iron transport protein B n=1 Tax=Alkalidesulfovibrio alkalitolerans DSM 16529 TaxID=1121439 RepID=S7TFX0_9BACT|nr:ferrous iron transport protein B [Alkalidesulfovibrio alkalitolerans]EPR35636.1 ferrous iron transport protein B [Alkalidesulfovibrio alkalitolerans DSM 16529]